LSEVCQPGVSDFGLPSWCVDYNFNVSSVFQLAIELLLLMIIFSGSYAYFDWRKKKRQEKEMLKRKQQENDAIISLDEKGRFN